MSEQHEICFFSVWREKMGIPFRKYFLFLFLFCVALMSATAQSSVKQITGKVTDKDGEGLPGVSILVKGTKTGTITNVDGVYSIKANPANAVLVFTYVGMMPSEVRVNNRTQVDVTMTEDRNDLDEVVVIGYGQVKKSDLTGSVSSISKDVVSDRVITSIEDAIKGKAAGLQITQNDGTPGSEYTIRIRGASSVNASSTPIYVIDGIICEDALDLSPGDVESIEILKDASSTAIYGSRGANGVIIITTKGGHEGKTKVDLYASFGFQQATRKYDMMNSREYARMKYQSSWQYYKRDEMTDDILNDPLNDVFVDSPVAGEGNYWVAKNDIPYKNYESYADSTNTDWQDAMFRNALVQEYRLTVSGGSKNTKFSVMGNYLNQQGIVVYSGFEKFAGRVNLEQKLSSKFKLNANVSVTRTSYDGLATGSSDGVTTSMLRQIPTKGLEENDVNNNEDEAMADVSSNPYYQAKHITKDRFRHSLITRLGLDYNINKHWMVRVTGTYVYNNNDNKTYYPKTVSQGVKQNGRAIQDRTAITKLMNEDLVYYNTTIKKVHKLKIMAGMTVEKYVDNYLWAENQNFTVENLGANAMGQGTSPLVPESYSSKNPYQMLSFLGRAEYNFKDRYLLTATMRADGSSRFGDNNKWGYFPSAAFGWRINEEEFVKELDIFSNLKLRLSAGRSGNTAIPAFRTLSTLSTSFAPMSGDKPTYGVVLDRPENKDLKWETTAQYDVGLDMGFFDNRLTVTVDAYLKRTKDLLLERNAPYYSGYKKAWANIGNIQNKGLEVTIGCQIVNTRDFYFNADFNIAFNRSKVLSIPGGEMFFDPKVISGSGNVVVIREGQPLGQWYGYKVDGVYTSQAEIDALPDNYEALSIKKADLRPGDHRFIDVNNDGKITSDDKTIIGKGEPDFSGGFSLSAGYKGFSLSAIFQYSYGVDVFNANLATLDAGRENYNQTRHLLDSYTPTLYDLNGNLVYQGNPNGKYRLPGGVAENYCLSEFIEDGSFLRLSDITLAYDFNRKTLAKLHLGGLRLFLTGRNLFVWTKYYGFDPEVNTRQNGIGDIMPSLDYGSYPRARAFSFGVNVSF